MADLNEALEQLGAGIKQVQILSSEDIVATPSAKGTKLRIRPKVKQASGGGAGGSSSGPVLCTITSGTTAAGYVIALYAKGFDQPSTGTATLQIIDQAFADNLASGEQYYVDPTTITVTGGSD